MCCDACLLVVMTNLGQVFLCEEDAQGTLQHLCDSSTGVSAHGFNALRIPCGRGLARALIHEAHIALLCEQHTGMVHLQTDKPPDYRMKWPEVQATLPSKWR